MINFNIHFAFHCFAHDGHNLDEDYYIRGRYCSARARAREIEIIETCNSSHVLSTLIWRQWFRQNIWLSKSLFSFSVGEACIFTIYPFGFPIKRYLVVFYGFRRKIAVTFHEDEIMLFDKIRLASPSRCTIVLRKLDFRIFGKQQNRPVRRRDRGVKGLEIKHRAQAFPSKYLSFEIPLSCPRCAAHWHIKQLYQIHLVKKRIYMCIYIYSVCVLEQATSRSLTNCIYLTL